MFQSLAVLSFLTGISISVLAGQRVDINAIASLNKHFGSKMLQVLGSEQGNIFFSPLSLSTLLSVIYIGSRGVTQKELGELGYLAIQRNNVNVPASYGMLLSTLQGSFDEYKLQIANALLVQAGYPILKEYKNTLVKYYDAVLKEVDFIQEGEQALQELNSWVRQKTNGNIQSFVDNLDNNILLILLNAVYFKGTWKIEFDTEMTKEKSFYNYGGNDSKTVPMMKVKDTFLYTYDDSKRFKAISLPYKGENIRMLIFLPFERDGITRLLEEISRDTVDETLKNLSDAEVILSLPKFKIEYSRNLKQYLRYMGIQRMFGNYADLSGITGDKDLYVADIAHKAVIEVNEEGSESSAVSGGFIVSRRKPLPEIIHEFTADHPFLFFIIDNRTKTPLFIGRVSEL